MTTIYTLSDERGNVRYVGKTTVRLALRLSDHLTKARRPGRGTRRSNWIRSVVARGAVPIISAIETTTGDGYFEERNWIAYFRGLGVDLVNATDGGEGTPGIIFSAQHRAKISAALRGITRSEKTRALIKKARAKQPPAHTTPHSEATRALIRLRLSDPAVREKIGAANRGRKRTDAEIEKWRKSRYGSAV